MKLTCVASGSSGNCYVLENKSRKKLVLDAGVAVKDIKKAIGFNIRDLSGILISHEHLDHSKAEKDLINMGAKIYAPYKDSKEARGIAYIDWDGFRIKPFELPHDGVTNFGFMISCDDMKILYMTDFEYCPYNFSRLNVDHILIECNYMDELVDEDAANFRHKVLGHASLKTCKEFIEANRTNALKSVLLLHLGGETSDPNKMVEEISKVVGNGVSVDYARPGLTIDLHGKDWCPF